MPLAGHPAGLGDTVFPTQGLPYSIANHPSNIKAVERGAEHLAAHENLAARERFARRMGLFDPRLAALRTALTACRVAGECDY
jgi:hypothetical protein